MCVILCIYLRIYTPRAVEQRRLDCLPLCRGWYRLWTAQIGSRASLMHTDPNCVYYVCTKTHAGKTQTRAQAWALHRKREHKHRHRCVCHIWTQHMCMWCDESESDPCTVDCVVPQALAHTRERGRLDQKVLILTAPTMMPTKVRGRPSVQHKHSYTMYHRMSVCREYFA